MSENQTYSPSPSPLIFAGKVNGTPVFNATGDRIGHIEDIAIDKASGQVAYAILAVGGFLGAGTRRYPLPWRVLTYDTSRNSYVTSIDKERLDQAPSFEMADLADVGDSDEHQQSWADHWGPFI